VSPAVGSAARKGSTIGICFGQQDGMKATGIQFVRDFKELDKRLFQ
jgi:hypothetical protein